MSRNRNRLSVAALSLAIGFTRAQTILGNYSSISNVSSSSCPTDGGVHIIVARASLEPVGYGIIGVVKDTVISNVPGSSAEYVEYPATMDNYVDSEGEGVSGLKSLVEAYLAQKDCSAPLVLMGYSQGAQVVADFLSGRSVQKFPYNASLVAPAPDATLARLAAAVLMGDPSLNITGGNPFHVGTSTTSGLFARDHNASAILSHPHLAGKLQSYCDAFDPYCASAGNFDNLSVHLAYAREYGVQAAHFVTQKIQAFSPPGAHVGEHATATAGASAVGMEAVRSCGLWTIGAVLAAAFL